MCIFLKKSIDVYKKKCIHGDCQVSLVPLIAIGRLAEWLMQRTANPFISVQFRYRPPDLLLFRLSSAVEQSAVNRSVICSNQIVGAKSDPLISLIACQRVFLLKIRYFFHQFRSSKKQT